MSHLDQLKEKLGEWRTANSAALDNKSGSGLNPEIKRQLRLEIGVISRVLGILRGIESKGSLKAPLMEIAKAK